MYHDGRIRPGALVVALVVAEHVRAESDAHRARLRQATIARWSHMSVRRVRDALGFLAALGVLEVDPAGPHKGCVFLLDWIAQWTPEVQRGPPPADETSGPSGRNVRSERTKRPRAGGRNVRSLQNHARGGNHVLNRPAPEAPASGSISTEDSQRTREGAGRQRAGLEAGAPDPPTREEANAVRPAGLAKLREAAGIKDPPIQPPSPLRELVCRPGGPGPPPEDDREPSPERVAAARARWADIDAGIDYEEEARAWIARRAQRPVGRTTGDVERQAECRHPRRMGGVCDACGYDDGTGFLPDPDRAGHEL